MVATRALRTMVMLSQKKALGLKPRYRKPSTALVRSSESSWLRRQKSTAAALSGIPKAYTITPGTPMPNMKICDRGLLQQIPSSADRRLDGSWPAHEVSCTWLLLVDVPGGSSPWYVTVLHVMRLRDICVTDMCMVKHTMMAAMTSLSRMVRCRCLATEGAAGSAAGSRSWPLESGAGRAGSASATGRDSPAACLESVERRPALGLPVAGAS
mmetsp:Transcript_15616/g.59283  ORF Transcript_15616/g.59283 Transcript_15616/m.59283 type:complete len:212 (+) Transcript_15616:610-1245(+)